MSTNSTYSTILIFQLYLIRPNDHCLFMPFFAHPASVSHGFVSVVRLSTAVSNFYIIGTVGISQAIPRGRTGRPRQNQNYYELFNRNGFNFMLKFSTSLNKETNDQTFDGRSGWYATVCYVFRLLVILVAPGAYGGQIVFRRNPNKYINILSYECIYTII